MKFQSSVELSGYLSEPSSIPRMNAGQHVTVQGNPGRFVGVSRAGVVWIVWPKKCGRKNVDAAIRIQSQAIKKYQ